MSNSNALFYRIDEDDVIMDIGGQWDEFARDNGGGQILKPQVLGTRLYQHIKGETCRTYVWTMLDAVRKLEKPIVRSYRCDSPTCKRFMTMRIVPESRNKLLLEHRLVSTQPFERTLRFACAPDSVHTRVTRCSMCNRLQIDGAWGEPELVLAHAAKSVTDATLVIYSVCMDCKTGAGIPPSLA